MVLRQILRQTDCQSTPGRLDAMLYHSTLIHSNKMVIFDDIKWYLTHLNISVYKRNVSNWYVFQHDKSEATWMIGWCACDFGSHSSSEWQNCCCACIRPPDCSLENVSACAFSKSQTMAQLISTTKANCTKSSWPEDDPTLTRGGG